MAVMEFFVIVKTIQSVAISESHDDHAPSEGLVVLNVHQA